METSLEEDHGAIYRLPDALCLVPLSVFCQMLRLQKFRNQQALDHHHYGLSEIPAPHLT